MQHIKKKAQAEIAIMREAGLIAYGAHEAAKALIRPGERAEHIDAVVDAYIRDHHAVPFFKGVPGVVPFPASCCISINNEVIHGIPGEKILQEGDIVSIDLGAKYQGWCSDTARSYAVGSITPEKQLLLDTTRKACELALQELNTKHKWSEIARDIETYIHAHHFSIVDIAEGHGIGRELWEEPSVPNYVTKSYIKYGDFLLEPNITIAIEPMVNMGSKEVHTANDHWTIVTNDKKPSAHFEHTVALTTDAPFILTAGPAGELW